MRYPLVSALVLLMVCGWGVSCTSEPEIDGRKVSEWVGLLRHQDWAVQEQAIEALSRLGAESIPYVMRSLRADDPGLRRGVARTLALIGPSAKEAVPALLVRISREDVPLVRQAILDALVRIAPRDETVQAEFTKRLRDVDPDVREAAQRGLEALKPKPPEPAPEPASVAGASLSEGAAAADRFVLREAVQAEVEKRRPGVAFGMVAEVVRAERRAAVVWPAIRQGKIVDDDIVAFIFERKGDGPWTLVAEVGPLRDATQLSEALGGADKQRLVRPCGVPRDQLADHLHKHGKAFADGLASGRTAEAMKAYEALTRAFSFSQAAYDDVVPETLAAKGFESAWKIDPSRPGNRLPVEWSKGGKITTGALELRPCGQGVVIGEIAIEP